MSCSFLLAAALAVALPGVALAEDAGGPPPLCTDRPAKGTSPCTVPKGSFQIESDLLNWTRDDQGGTRTDTILFTSPTLKYGLTDSTDIQANLSPYETVRTRDASGTTTLRGVGDLTVRIKQRLTGEDAKLQLALIPYLKVPTAKDGIGNGKVEGGLVGAAQVSLPDGFAINLTPEIDYLANSDRSGHHAQLVGSVNVSKALTKKLTATAELWTAQDYDPAGTTHQYSLDLALAYQSSSTLQFDAGTNIGLNRDTPDIQAYVGIATRF